ncbi:uncharacterized protein LOC102806844 [Saccoglossus kowalevskii]|uniref:Uncharacterized protein LOC102806844 n=1 Tax=Saccoglossus kowalevskii TaxID=10224 RepID=A0ABM0M087_SACKO|nr:PREDICTED: uncharacterized protein LOC102806844 [Saccoglossus kowalevskii]
MVSSVRAKLRMTSRSRIVFVLGAVILISLYVYHINIIHTYRPPDISEIRVSDELVTIAKAIKQKHGFVVLQFLNSGFLTLTKNWICNVECFSILPKTIFITTDVDAYRGLAEWKDDLNVILLEYGTKHEMTYGEVIYYYFGLFRVKIMNQLLQRNFSIFETEADATWFDDPLEYFAQSSVDMVVMQNKGKHCQHCMVNGGFLYINATHTSQRMWNELTRQLTEKMKGYRNQEGWRNIGMAGSEQVFLSDIIETEKSANIQWLPVERFVSGLWYTNKEIRSHTQPIVILNNHVLGNAQKIERAKLWGHWSLSADNIRCRHDNCHKDIVKI